MSINFQSIVDLEQIDIEIARLENSKREYPVKVAEMSVTLSEKATALDKINRLVSEVELEKSRANTVLEENKKELETSHERLNLVKTNREYDAILLEIKERKDMIERSRKKIEKCKEKISKNSGNLVTAQGEFDEVSSELKPQIDDLTSKIDSIDDDISKVENDRPVLEAAVPDNYKNIYARIRSKRKNGRVLSIINSESKSCGYCRQLISPNIKKIVQTSSSPIMCENCGSVFAWIDAPLAKEIKEEEK